MSDVSIADLRVGQKDLEGKLELVRTDINYAKAVQALNHAQNRRDIHDLRDIAQTAVDGLSELKIKWARAAGYAVGAGAVIGAVVSLITKAIEHFWR